MKYQDSKSKDDNLFLFPNLENRILEKGLNYLQKHQYRDAIQLFEEAQIFEPESPDLYIGLILAYAGAGSLHKAKGLAREMLQKGIGDYFETIDLYLMLLLQLQEYEEIIATIELLLEEREIPSQRFEHFAGMLNFSRRMVDKKSNEKPLVAEHNPNPTLNLLEDQNIESLLLKMSRLEGKNIRPYIEEIKLYLEKREGHPFVKTLLLNILKENEYDKSLLVNKFGLDRFVVPTELKNLHENEQKEKIEKELHQQLDNEDPVLLQQILSLLDRHSFLMYPFEFSPESPAVWAAAYHFTCLQYLGIESSPDKVGQLYGVPKKKIEKTCQFIRELEKISYPNI